MGRGGTNPDPMCLVGLGQSPGGIGVGAVGRVVVVTRGDPKTCTWKGAVTPSPSQPPFWSRILGQGWDFEVGLGFGGRIRICGQDWDLGAASGFGGRIGIWEQD